jgi:hypothetical protein
MKTAKFEINSLYMVTDANSDRQHMLRVVDTGSLQGSSVVFFRDCQSRNEYTGRLSERGQFAKLYFSEAPDTTATVINASDVTLTADGRG